MADEQAKALVEAVQTVHTNLSHVMAQPLAGEFSAARQRQFATLLTDLAALFERHAEREQRTTAGRSGRLVVPPTVHHPPGR